MLRASLLKLFPNLLKYYDNAPEVKKSHTDENMILSLIDKPYKTVLKSHFEELDAVDDEPPGVQFLLVEFHLFINLVRRFKNIKDFP